MGIRIYTMKKLSKPNNDLIYRIYSCHSNSTKKKVAQGGVTIVCFKIRYAVESFNLCIACVVETGRYLLGTKCSFIFSVFLIFVTKNDKSVLINISLENSEILYIPRLPDHQRHQDRHRQTVSSNFALQRLQETKSFLKSTTKQKKERDVFNLNVNRLFVWTFAWQVFLYFFGSPKKEWWTRYIWQCTQKEKAFTDKLTTTCLCPTSTLLYIHGKRHNHCDASKCLESILTFGFQLMYHLSFFVCAMQRPLL